MIWINVKSSCAAFAASSILTLEPINIGIIKPARIASNVPFNELASSGQTTAVGIGSNFFAASINRAK